MFKAIDWTSDSYRQGTRIEIMSTRGIYLQANGHAKGFAICRSIMSEAGLHDRLDIPGVTSSTLGDSLHEKYAYME